MADSPHGPARFTGACGHRGRAERGAPGPRRRRAHGGLRIVARRARGVRRRDRRDLRRRRGGRSARRAGRRRAHRSGRPRDARPRSPPSSRARAPRPATRRAPRAWSSRSARRSSWTASRSGRSTFSATARRSRKASASSLSSPRASSHSCCAFSGPARPTTDSAAERALVLAGEALAAGADNEHVAEHVARLAADAAGARAVVLWRADGGEPELAASFGESPAAESAALSAARIALDSRTFLIQERIGGAAVRERASRRAGGRRASARVRPGSGRERPRRADDVRAACGAGPSRRRRSAGGDARARADARAARDRRARRRRSSRCSTRSRPRSSTSTVLVGADRVAVYLREGKRLQAAAVRNLTGPHGVVAEKLLELALGPYRGRGIVVVPTSTATTRSRRVGDAAGEAGIRCGRRAAARRRRRGDRAARRVSRASARR